MMIEESDDHIDKTQWIRWDNEIDEKTGKPIDPMVKPERAAKCDMKIEYNDKSEIRFAQAQVRNILNYLWEIDAIDDQLHHDAQTFQIWREMHQTSLGFKKAVSSGSDEVLGVRLRAFGYVLIMQRLRHTDQKAIIYAIETFANNHAKYFANQHKASYHATIERLSFALIPIREQIAYMENLSEAEREQLSDDRLKKLVAEISKHA